MLRPTRVEHHTVRQGRGQGALNQRLLEHFIFYFLSSEAARSGRRSLCRRKKNDHKIPSSHWFPRPLICPPFCCPLFLLSRLFLPWAASGAGVADVTRSLNFSACLLSLPAWMCQRRCVSAFCPTGQCCKQFTIVTYDRSKIGYLLLRMRRRGSIHLVTSLAYLARVVSYRGKLFYNIGPV